VGGAKPIRGRERGQVVQAVEAEQRGGAGRLGKVAVGSSPAKVQATAGSIEAEVSSGSRQAPPWTCTRYRGSPDGESAPGRDVTGAPMSSVVCARHLGGLPAGAPGV
jgi:hypothetical protein